jgi:hypothetical protein
MASYQVYVICSECSGAHRLEGRVDVPYGPTNMTSVDDVFHGKTPPPEVTLLINKFSYCERAKRPTAQTDLTQIFLVPAE